MSSRTGPDNPASRGPDPYVGSLVYIAALLPQWGSVYLFLQRELDISPYVFDLDTIQPKVAGTPFATET